MLYQKSYISLTIYIKQKMISENNEKKINK